LSETLGERVFVGNAGRDGHFTLNHDYLLRHYPLAERFEWVVVMAGINDLGRLLRNDYRERSYRVPEETLIQNAKMPYYRGSMLYRLAITRLRGDAVVQDPEGQWIAEKRAIRRKALSQGPISAPPEGLEEALAVYRQNLRKIIGSCRSRDQNILMLTQPTMYRKDMPEALRELLWAHVSEKAAYTEETLAFLVDAYNRAMIEVCRDEGVDCIDLASLLPKDTSVFYDDCHFNVSGCEQIANILARYFTDRLARNPSVKTTGIAEGVSTS
jgi:lysophospholipase L1-like esterase